VDPEIEEIFDAEIAMQLERGDPQEDWFFTFGFDRTYGGVSMAKRYIKISGTHSQARKKMYEHFGRDWAFQYNAAKFAPQPTKYGLTEYELTKG
jgi:hypothetical protein